MLDHYDHEQLDTTGNTEEKAVLPSKWEYLAVIQGLRSEFSSGVFAQPRDQSFESSVAQIGQRFEGRDLYPSIEEKAAMLLYLIVKNHSFVDGNKRIGAGGFLYFLAKNNLLFSRNNQPIISNEALVKLGALNSFSRLIPNTNLFIKLHITKEAVLSSRIEGTQTRIDEALFPIEEINPERRNDWQEVQNYIDAMNEAIAELRRLPLSSRLMRKTHYTLMQSVRGEHKQPGEFRKSQNWIGGIHQVFAPRYKLI